MSNSPQRPPRPDEDELTRFHNGDTLDNIPVIRLPTPPSPQGWSWRALGSVAVLAAVVSALAVAGALHLAASDGPGADARRPAAAPSHGRAAASPPTRSSPATDAPSPAEPERPSPSEPLAVAAQPQLEQVRVIQAPATGGDPSTAYCLVYTGSDSAGAKDAILLTNAPAYQCTDLLPYDEYESALSTEVPVCEPPARAAVLSFADTSEWAGTVYFTCLTQHTGA